MMDSDKTTCPAPRCESLNMGCGMAGSVVIRAAACELWSAVTKSPLWIRAKRNVEKNRRSDRSLLMNSRSPTVALRAMEGKPSPHSKPGNCGEQETWASFKLIRPGRRHATGFSLVEVNLAIFVVAIGLLTLFSLFPAGLKEGEAGHADTQAALFAEYALATLRAGASEIEGSQWNAVTANRLWTAANGGSPSPQESGSPTAVEFPEGSGLYVRYILERVQNGSLYDLTLWVAAGQYGTSDANVFKQNAEQYFTQIFFSGMP
jgi:hypothetical protein